jgi:putative membrane protein insertion efficiency factor
MRGIRTAVWRTGAPVRILLLGLIGVYRLTLSGVLGGQCRFHPTCSAYAHQAIRNRGAVQGTVLSVWRVLRCSPLSKGGVDDPPPAPAWRTDAPSAYENVIQTRAEARA